MNLLSKKNCNSSTGQGPGSCRRSPFQRIFRGCISMAVGAASAATAWGAIFPLTKQRRVRVRVQGRRLSLTAAASLCAWLLILTAPSVSFALTTSAVQDLSCAGFRQGEDLNCTAGEFTVNPVFSAAPGTPPFCVAGSSFSFLVDLNLSGTNTDRQDVGFFVGQQGNDPRLSTPGNNCSVATFPNTPLPWKDNDLDSCGDYQGGANFTTTIDQIKVVCAGDSAGALNIPFVVTYWQNNGAACSGPADIVGGNKAKCNSGISPVSGTVAVFSGAYVDVTKQTLPDGDSQPFSFTATGPAGSKVIALTGAVLTADSATGGSYSPATIAAAGNSVSVTLNDGETARIYINALATDQTLTITEAATANWESDAAISCSAVRGAPTISTNGATRTISALLNQTDSAAACTVTNTKRPRITLQKQVSGRIAAADQFRVSAGGGGTLSGTTQATTAGAGTLVSTTFYSTPGAALTLTDQKVAGPTPFSAYVATLTCSNAFTGSGATPAGSLPDRQITSTYSLTPVPGDEITCTYTNTPRATLGKAYSPSSIGETTSSTLTFTINNGAGNPAQENLAFTDSFPAGLTVTAVGPVTGAGCSGTPSFTASTVSLASGAMTAGTAACYFTATVRGDLTGTYLNGSASLSGQGGGIDTSGVSATLSVFLPPTVAKSFGAAAISVGFSTTLTLTLANPAANVGAITGVMVDDDFPGGVTLLNTTFAFTPAACGTVTNTSGGASAAGDGNMRLSAASLAPGDSCQVTVNIAGTSPGAITNTTDPPTATGPGSFTGSSASAGITVYPLPLLSILKSADKTSVDPGQEVIYTVQVVNSGDGPGIQVMLTDLLSPYGSFYLGGGAPFSFFDSSPPSGLSLGAPDYSSDNGVTWGYSPVSGGGGAPPGYDGAVTNWRLPLTGTIRAGGSFALNYRIVVR